MDDFWTYLWLRSGGWLTILSIVLVIPGMITLFEIPLLSILLFFIGGALFLGGLLQDNNKSKVLLIILSMIPFIINDVVGIWWII